MCLTRKIFDSVEYADFKEYFDSDFAFVEKWDHLVSYDVGRKVKLGRCFWLALEPSLDKEPVEQSSFWLEIPNNNYVWFEGYKQSKLQASTLFDSGAVQAIPKGIKPYIKPVPTAEGLGITNHQEACLLLTAHLLVLMLERQKGYGAPTHLVRSQSVNGVSFAINDVPHDSPDFYNLTGYGQLYFGKIKDGRFANSIGLIC